MNTIRTREEESSGRVKHSLRRILAPINKVTPATLASAVPFPGWHELRNAVKILADSLQNDPVEQDHYSTINLKIRHLLSLTTQTDWSDVDGIKDLERELREIQKIFDEINMPKNLGFGDLERRLQILDDLDRRTNNTINLMQLILQAHTRLSCNTDQFDVIQPHDILNQTVLPTREELERSQLTPRRIRVTSNKGVDGSLSLGQRSGRIGNMPVIYRTYSTIDTVDASKLVKAQLALYSQCLHPNITTVLGITKGPRLNGIVLASATLPYEEFLRQVKSPITLARCFQEFQSASLYFKAKGVYPKRICPEIARVDPDGHVLVTVTDDADKLIWLPPANGSTIPNLDPAVRALVRVIDSHPYDGPRTKLLDLVEQNQDLFTELKAYQLADQAYVLPEETELLGIFNSPPVFTILPGDIGAYVQHTEQTPSHCFETTFDWVSLDAQFAVEHATPEAFWPGRDPHFRIQPMVAITSHGWLTLELPQDCVQVRWHSGLGEENKFPIWRDLVAYWVRISKAYPEIRLETICACIYMIFCVAITHREPLPKGFKLYFHRCPVARSDPSSFWGYFSTSSDYAQQEHNLVHQGWTFEYKVWCVKLDIVDDWGYKYKQLLKKSMRSIPGSFPAVELDESSNEEASQT